MYTGIKNKKFKNDLQVVINFLDQFTKNANKSAYLNIFKDPSISQGLINILKQLKDMLSQYYELMINYLSGLNENDPKYQSIENEFLPIFNMIGSEETPPSGSMIDLINALLTYQIPADFDNDQKFQTFKNDIITLLADLQKLQGINNKYNLAQ